MIRKTACIALWLGLLGTLQAVAATVPAAAGVPAEPDWQKVKDTDDGIVLYEREVPGSPIMAFKGNAIIDAPVSKVASAIFDISRAKEWVLNLEETRRVRWFSPDEFLQYDHIGTPIVLKDRDFVSRVKMTVDNKTKSVTFEYSSVSDPELPETKYVRGELMRTLFVLSPANNGAGTRVDGEIHADPKGSVAKWIVNFFQRQWPIDTIRSLRKYVARDDIKIDQHFVSIK